MKKILIISILITASFSKDSNINIGIHGGLLNINNQNIVAVSVGYSAEAEGKFYDRINANIAVGLLPYLPTIGFNLLAEFNINKNSSFITGFSWEYNIGVISDIVDTPNFSNTIPIAYKLNFDINDNFDSFLLLGLKIGIQITPNDAEEEVMVEKYTYPFLSMGFGVKF